MSPSCRESNRIVHAAANHFIEIYGATNKVASRVVCDFEKRVSNVTGDENKSGNSPKHINVKKC
jgi:hypothetical protein